MNTYENWEEFAAGPNRLAEKKVHVSLNYKGPIFLNARAVEALGSPEAVTLHFETRRAKIGLRPCSIKTPNAFPLMRLNGAHSRTILASPFCRNYGIKTDGTVAFHDIDIDNDGMMILDLAKTTRVSRIMQRPAR